MVRTTQWPAMAFPPQASRAHLGTGLLPALLSPPRVPSQGPAKRPSLAQTHNVLHMGKDRGFSHTLGILKWTTNSLALTRKKSEEYFKDIEVDASSMTKIPTFNSTNVTLLRIASKNSTQCFGRQPCHPTPPPNTHTIQN